MKTINGFVIFFVVFIFYSEFASGQSTQPVLKKIQSFNSALGIEWTYSNFSALFFKIYRRKKSDKNYQMVQQVPGSDRSKLDYWLTNDTLYYYRTSAIDINNNESNWSDSLSGKPVNYEPQLISIYPFNCIIDSVVTEDISGINFIPGDQFSLRNGSGTSIPALDIFSVTPEKISCSFDLKSKPVGVYDLVLVRNGSIKSTLKNVFTIKNSLNKFTEISESVGLNFTNHQSHGAAWGDYDNDQKLDLFVVNLDMPWRLYHNISTMDKDTFELVNLGSNAENIGSSAVAMIDYNNDGYLDIFCGSLSSTKCLLENQPNYNNGQREFIPVGDKVGLVESTYTGSISVTWADYNNDGYLDFYFIPYNIPDPPNYLFTQMNGKFIKRNTINIGADIAGDESYCAGWADFDNDGNMDLYIGNGSVNRLFRNLGDETFQVVQDPQLIIESQNHTENTAWGDFNNDGNIDLYIANTNANYPKSNTLYINKGDGSFVADISSPINDIEGFGFAPAWGDFDNDGDLDLFLARGGYREEGQNPLHDLKGQVNRLFENRDNQFFDITAEVGLNDTLIGTSAIWGDYNNDGYLDLFVTTRDARNPPLSPGNRLYKNPGGDNNYIKISLNGTVSNKSGVGARVELINNNILQVREISGGEGRSHAGVTAHFGLGQSSIVQKLTVRWPSGIEQYKNGESANKHIVITEPDLPQPDPPQAIAFPGKVKLKIEHNPGITDIFGYNIYRNTSNIFKEDSIIAKVVQKEFFIDSLISKNIIYTYWIRATDIIGNRSKLSNPVSIIDTIGIEPDLSAPDTIYTIVKDKAIMLKWPDNRKTTDITAYSIYKSNSAEFNENTRVIINYRDTTFIDSTGNSYCKHNYYWVRGVIPGNAIGKLSDSISVTPHKIGDFRSPFGIIDGNDLSAFRDAYLEAMKGNIDLNYDIGPQNMLSNNGLTYDNKIDFEDLVTFIQSWREQLIDNTNYCNDPNNLKSSGISVVGIEPHYFNNGELDLNIILLSDYDIKAGQLDFSYDPEEIEIENVNYGNMFSVEGKEPLFFEYNQKSIGKYFSVVCPLVTQDVYLNSLQKSTKKVLFSAKMKITDAIQEPNIAITYKLYMAFADSFTEGTINFKIKDFGDEILSFQNYPNPFVQNTTIAYTKTKSGWTTLKVVDILGREVKTLVNKWENEGSYEVTWDKRDNNGNKVTFGIYYCHLMAGRMSKSIKMILTKE
ncbi:MAG: FG-GAP-like repeat-containing protein [Bacteroidota bacterium]